MMKKYLIPVFATLFLVNVKVSAQQQIKKPDGTTISTTAIDGLISKLMDTAEVTGLCLGIINNNRIAYVKAYGYKDSAKALQIDTSTCFYAASLAKPLFAYIVMQLVDKGSLDLDKPLYTYLPKPLPEYEKYKDLAGDERWKLLTARHCLSHTTGFPNFRFFNPKGNKKLEFFFMPGSRYAYSGEGLQLLQFVIETITSKNLEELAQENIFKPFGMTRTSFLWQPDFETNYAVGFDMNGDALPKRRRKKPDAAGSMETTIADYSRFIEAGMQGRGLSKKAIDEMRSVQVNIKTKSQFPTLTEDTIGYNDNIKLAYGLGSGLFNTPYGKAFFKEGHDDGWGHYNINIPGKKISYLIMTNSSNGESIFKELLEKLAGVTVPWVWESYAPYRATIKLPVTVLQNYTGIYEGEKFSATISVVNGQLKVESAKAELPLSNMYAENDYHFFLKVSAVEIEFVKDGAGNIDKMIVMDEGGKFELKKIK